MGSCRNGFSVKPFPWTVALLGNLVERAGKTFIRYELSHPYSWTPLDRSRQLVNIFSVASRKWAGGLSVLAALPPHAE